APAPARDAEPNDPRDRGEATHARADRHRSVNFHVPALRHLPREIWSASFPTAESLGTPLVDDGVLYSGGSEGTLYAIDAATGAVRWTAGGFEAIETAVAISGGVVVASGMNRNVRALDRRDGRLLWTRDVGTF